MALKLQLVKDDILLYEHDYDVKDAESFGLAFADVWARLRQTSLTGKAASAL